MGEKRNVYLVTGFVYLNSCLHSRLHILCPYGSHIIVRSGGYLKYTHKNIYNETVVNSLCVLRGHSLWQHHSQQYTHTHTGQRHPSRTERVI